MTNTTWNPIDKTSNITLSGSNLVATWATGSQTGAVRSSSWLTSGKYYWEITFTTAAAIGCGVANSSAVLSNGVSGGAGTALVNNSGQIYINNWTTLLATISAFTTGSVCCIALDTASNLIWFRNGAGNWNASSTANPATSVGGFSTTSISSQLYALGYSQSTNGGVLTANFGDSAFSQIVPSGFISGFPFIAGSNRVSNIWVEANTSSASKRVSTMYIETILQRFPTNRSSTFYVETTSSMSPVASVSNRPSTFYIEVIDGFVETETGDYAIYMLDEAGHLWYSYDTGITWTQTKSSQPIDRGCSDWFSDMTMAVNDGESRKLLMTNYDPSIQNYPGVPLMPDDDGNPDNGNEGSLGNGFSYMGGLYLATAEGFGTAPTIWYGGSPNNSNQFYTESCYVAASSSANIIFISSNYNYDNYCYADPLVDGWPFFYYNRISYDAGVTWQNVSGLPTTNYFSSIAFSQNANIMYIVIDSLGIYKSTDKGHTWSLLINAPVFPTSGSSNFGTPINNKIICSQDGSVVGICYIQNFYLSINGGATWTTFDLNVLLGGSYTYYYSSFGMSIDGIKLILACNVHSTIDQIFVLTSINKGSTWTKVTSNTFTSSTGFYTQVACNVSPDGGAMIIAFVDSPGNIGDVGYTAVALSGHCFISTNNGSTWTTHTITFGYIEYDTSYTDAYLKAYIVPSGTSGVYNVYMFDIGGYLYSSTDTGSTYTTTTMPAIGNQTIGYPISPGINETAVNRWLDMSMAVNDSDYNNIFTVNLEVWGGYGGDFTGNFISFDTSATEGYTARSGLSVGTKTTIGTNTIINFSTNSYWPYTGQSSAISTNGTILVAVTRSGLNNHDKYADLAPMLSHNNGATWQQISALAGFNYETAAFSQNASVMYIQRINGKMWKSTDGGITWIELINSFSDGPISGITEGFTCRLRCSQNGNVVGITFNAAGTHNFASFYLSVDGGNTWTSFDFLSMIDSTSPSIDLFDFGMSLTGNVILISAEYNDGNGNWLPAAWITKNHGTTWNPVTPLIPDGSASGYMVCSVAPDGLGMVLTYDTEQDPGFVDVSTNGGITWINRTFSMTSTDGSVYDTDLGYFYSAIMVKPSPVVLSYNKAYATILA